MASLGGWVRGVFKNGNEERAYLDDRDSQVQNAEDDVEFRFVASS